MVELLEALVGGDRCAHPLADAVRQVGGGLFAEQPEQVRGMLQVGPRRRVGDRQESGCDPDNHRVDARFQEGDPRDQSEPEVHDPVADAPRPGQVHDSQRSEPDEQRGDLDRAAVGGRDHDERRQVVGDRDGEDERAQALREAASDQCQHPQRESGVGRHRRAPSVRGAASGVEREVDRDRDDHPAERGCSGQRQPPAVAQVAEIEFPAAPPARRPGRRTSSGRC